MDRISLYIRTATDWTALVAKLSGWDFDKYPRKITIERDSGDPVQDCFAVFWIWMKQLAKKFSTEDKEYTSEEMHDIMCHKFLGYTDRRKIGNTWLEPALVTLTYPDRKSKDRMCVLLSQIDEWALDHGVFLATKKLSDYAKYKEAQVTK